MPLRLIRSPSARRLWEACVDRFLAEAGEPGPAHRTHLWLTHRVHRDALYEAAARRGVPGWLAPPVSHFSALPRLFGIGGRPAGVFRRQLVLGRLAAREAARLGFGALRGRGLGHAFDALFGEWLAEGVTPEAADAALARVEGDAFARARNAWVLGVFRAYLSTLEAWGRYDPRALHALVARRIREGGLARALGGARSLHIYGVTSLAARRRLFEALRDQDEVEVSVYLVEPAYAAGGARGPAGAGDGDGPGNAGAAEEDDEWAALGCPVERLDGAPPEPRVMPAPDARREYDWAAIEAKRALVEQGLAPHEVAVVVRTGRADAPGVYAALRRAGVPATARLRSVLAEVPALRAIASLLRGAADGWPYRALRDVVTSAYFDLRIDPTLLDRVARERRVDGLDAWRAALEDAAGEACGADSVDEDTTPHGHVGRGSATSAPARGSALAEFDRFADEARALEAPRPLREWIRTTRELLDPGRFGFRRRICDDAGGRFEIVRLDQRAVRAACALLDEWAELEAGEDGSPEPVGPGAWLAEFLRVLESAEIALTTPEQKGVQVLEAHEAALFPFRKAFVVHANEGEFPRAPRPGLLFSDDERRALAEHGLPMRHRELEFARERLLFRAVTAGDDVTITYRTADAEGRPLLPSLEVPDHDPDCGIPRTRFVWETPVRPAQAVERAGARLAAQARAGTEPAAGVATRSGGPGAPGAAARPEARRVAVPDPAALRRAVLAAYAEWHRGARPAGSPRAGQPGPWSGLVRDPELRRRLEERYGDAYVWSASQLETYAACPFHFFIEQVLGIAEQEDEAEEATTASAFGRVAHRLLERFYAELERLVASPHAPLPNELEGAVRDLYERVADEVFRDVEAGLPEPIWLGVPAIWRATRRQIRDAVRQYLAWELSRLAGRRPVYREYAFGFGGDPVELRGADVRGVVRTLRLRGRVDRVDVSGSAADLEYHILDYKSGSAPEGAMYRDGAALQIPLYMRAVESCEGVRVASGEYRSIRHARSNGRCTRNDDRYAAALAIAFSIPERVRRGIFEPRMAASVRRWPWYKPGLDVCRVDAVMPKDTTRFDDS